MASDSVFDLEIRANVTGLTEQVRRIEQGLSDVPLGLSLDRRSLREVQRLQNAISVSTSAGFVESTKSLSRNLVGTVKGFFKTFDTENRKSTDTLSKRLKEAWNNGLGESAKKTMSDLGSFVEDWQSKMTVGGIKGMIQSLGDVGGKISAKGAGMKEKAAGMPTGAMSKMMGGMGGMLSKLGPAVTALGAVAGLLASVVKAIIDADDEIKDFNKSLFQSGVTAADLGAGFGNVRETLQEVQNAAYDFTNNRAWATMPQDQAKILAAFNAQGYTLKEMTKQAEKLGSAMKAYQEATASALTYARLFGKSAEEIATDMAKFMEEQNMTLKEVEERYAGVYQAAQTAGFGTKRFYSMMLQATAGTSQYNVRIEEAAGLLVLLSKAMSPEAAGAFLQTLTKGFAGEGMVDRYKRVITTGVGLTEEIVSQSAANMAADFTSKFSEQGKAIKKVLSIDMAMDINSPEGQEEIVKKLAEMSPEQQAKAIAKIKLETGDENIGIALQKLISISEGTKGGVGNLAMSLEGLDMGGKLAMSLSQGMAVFGKPLHELGDKELAAMESMMGISGEQGMELRRVSEALYGNYNTLEEMRKAGEKGDPTTMKQQAEMFGAAIDENGNLIQATWDEATQELVRGGKIEDINDYLMSQGDALAATMEESADVNELLAREISANTLKTSEMLEMAIKYYLKEIAGYTGQMVVWLMDIADFAGEIPDAAEVRKSLDATSERIAAAQDDQIKAQQALAEAERNYATAKNADEKAAAQEAIDLAKEQVAAADAQLVMQKAFREQIASSTSGTIDDFQKASWKSSDAVIGAIDSVWGPQVTAAQEKEASAWDAYNKALAGGDQDAIDLALEGIREANAAVAATEGMATGETVDRLLTEIVQAEGERRGLDDEGMEELMRGTWERMANYIADGMKPLDALKLIEENTASLIEKGLIGHEGKSETDLKLEAGAKVAEDIAETFYEGPTSPWEVGKSTFYAPSEAIEDPGTTLEDIYYAPSRAIESTYEFVADSSVGEAIGEGLSSAGDYIAFWEDDFIWRPGEGAASINPNDILFGVQDPTTLMGEVTGGGGATPSPTLAEKTIKDIFGKDKEDLNSVEKAAAEEMGLFEEQYALWEESILPELEEPTWVAPTEEAKERFLTSLSKSEMREEEDLLDDQAKEIAKEIVKEETKARAYQMAQAAFGAGGIPGDIARAIEAMDFSLGIIPQELLDKFGGGGLGPEFNDFIFRPGQKPVSFSSGDTLIGAKEGGPLAKAAKTGGGTVNLTIVHPDTQMVYNTVKKVLTDTGIV